MLLVPSINKLLLPSSSSSTRRMFPPLKVDIFDLDPNTYYVLLMDMTPVDKYRYKFQTSRWVKCFEEECATTRLYVHPDSPALGSHWMNCVVSFYKLKLTNNQLDRQGHVSALTAHVCTGARASDIAQTL